MRTRHYHNGFKTALLLGGMWALLLLIGSGIAMEPAARYGFSSSQESACFRRHGPIGIQRPWPCVR